MRWFERITRSNFLIRLKSWEYWPFGIIQFPAIVYWLWLSLRARSLVFFSASNPGIPMGGMFGESKFDVLKKVPARYTPNTLLITFPVAVDEVIVKMQEAGMTLPVIFKPDIGERGYLVKRINDKREIAAYIETIRGSFLVQELIELPLEFGVFYMKMPTETTGTVVSVVAKEMLSVTGDGKSTIRDLIFRNERAILQWEKLKEAFHGRLDDVVAAGEKLELVSIGNHAAGTKFLNGNHLINERLNRTFDRISDQIPGFYFGRYDLRCASIEDLYEGNVKIMELNGCGAEPAHIYDPDFSLWEAFRVQVIHWRRIFLIATANKGKGIHYATHKEAFKYYRKFKAAVK